MEINLAAWTSEGLRCPDITVELRRGDGTPAPVSLIQMPNGTGKTTTLELLKASLHGKAEGWSKEEVRRFRRPGDPRPYGRFTTTLLVDKKPLTIQLTLDYENGHAKYRTSSPGSGGYQPRWHVPPTVHRFLSEEFLSLFVFDGEFADRLFDPSEAEAEHAISALCQLYLVKQVSLFADEYWQQATKKETGKTTTALTRWQSVRTAVRARQAKLSLLREEAQKDVAALKAEIATLNERIAHRLSTVQTTKDRFEEADKELRGAEVEVDTSAANVMAALRMPQNLHPLFGAQLVDLKDNLDKLKLPENTSAQFFQELMREDECICGRPMTKDAQDEIAVRSKQYLDAAESGTINALKEDIERFTTTSEEEGTDLDTLVGKLSKGLREKRRAELAVRTLSEQLVSEGDEQLGQWQEDLAKAEDKLADSIALLEALAGPGSDDERSEETYSLALLAKRLDEANARIAEITDTVRLRAQVDLVKGILEKAGQRARQRIKEQLVDVCNDRIRQVLMNDPLQIERIDRSIRLANQDGASVGQTLSVGYTFLMSVLNRGNNDFPLVVDSPANPIDATVRRQIGKLIPSLCSQFVGFTISTERLGFVNALEESNQEIKYLTLFRKTPGTERLLGDLPAGRFKETDNAVLVEDRDYFHRFDIEKEA